MDHQGVSRREFLKLAGLGGVVLVAGAASTRGAVAATGNDFYFVQLSDTHWGFEGAAINPDAAGTLKKAVAAVNGLSQQPDFIMFTGDLTHTTDDPKERRKRMQEFRDIVAALKVKDVRYMPGEHDASLDNGKGVQGILWRDPLYLRSQRRAFHRRRQRLRSDRGDRRRAIAVAERGSRQAAQGRANRRVHAPAIVRPLSAVGLGDATAPRRSRCCKRTTTSPSSTGTFTRKITS